MSCYDGSRSTLSQNSTLNWRWATLEPHNWRSLFKISQSITLPAHHPTHYPTKYPNKSPIKHLSNSRPNALSNTLPNTLSNTLLTALHASRYASIERVKWCFKTMLSFCSRDYSATYSPVYVTFYHASNFKDQSWFVPSIKYAAKHPPWFPTELPHSSLHGSLSNTLFDSQPNRVSYMSEVASWHHSCSLT